MFLLPKYSNSYEKIVTFSIILPQFSILYSVFNFSLNIISISFCVILILYLPFKFKRYNLNFNLRAFLFIIAGGILYINESKGGLIILLSLLIYFLLSLSKNQIDLGYYIFLKNQLKLLFGISLISFILFVFKLTIPFEFFMEGRGSMYVHFFLLSDFPSFEPLNPNTWRFYGFLNEPGAAAAISGTLIVKEKFKFKGNEIFWLTVLASFSSGIFVALLITYICINMKIDYVPYIVALLIFILLFYFFGANSSNLFVSYLHEKVFYFTYDFFSFKDDRLQYSFLKYLSEAPIFFFLYVCLLFLIPTRFGILFLIMGLYRHHFILNTLPFLLLIFYGSTQFSFPKIFDKIKLSDKFN
jgi:hypothetical protein